MTGDHQRFPLDQFQGFAQAIQGELRKGYGFVPLLGAGISAESGVPLIPEVTAYLAKCIARALGVYAEKDEGLKRRWYPKTDNWPRFRDLRPEDEEDAYNQIAAELKRLREKDGRHPEIPVLQKALGDLADWRSALLFLASLQRTDENKNDRPMRLGPPDYDIVDAFFRNATSGKRPTLPHHLLALLSQPMRIDVLLTTNFDELLEQAFHEAEVPLDPVEVHLHASLPSFRHIGQRRSLVKLHGGRYGLRADYSLDQDPTPDEQLSFASYFYEEDAIGKLSSNARNHFLVIGMSAEDRRVMQFISRACERGVESESDPPKIFWICYSSQDEVNIREKLADSLGKSEQGDERFFVLQHQFTGLLLLQLWQVLTCTLPPRFAIFPFSTRISTPPVLLTPRQIDLLDRRITAGIDKSGVEIKRYVAETFYGDLRRHHRLLRLSAKTGQHGVTSKGAHHFYRALRAGRKCVWLSLENVSSTDELFEHLTDAIARVAGISDWLPIVLFDQNEKALREIHRLTEGRNQWVIFLDTRDGAGASLDLDFVNATNPNGWLDKRRRAGSKTPSNQEAVDDGREELDDGSSNAEEFVALLSKLAGPECPNIRVVLMYHQTFNDGKKDTTTGLERALEAHGFPPAIIVENGVAHIESLNCDESTLELSIPEQGEKYSHVDVWKVAVEWVKEDANERVQRAFFLLGLCCAQRTRFPSLLLSVALHPPSRLEADDATTLDSRSEAVAKWTRSLASKRMIRFLPGGFIWLHAQVKDLLRKELGIPNPAIIGRLRERSRKLWQEFGTGIPLQLAIYRAQLLLGRWYERLFLSSNDPLAGLEAVFHYFEAAKIAAFSCTESVARKRDRFELSVSHQPWEQLCESLSAAADMLERVKPIAYSSGYPKASCRRLVFIRRRSLLVLREFVSGKISQEKIRRLAGLAKSDHADPKGEMLRRLDDMVIQTLKTKRGIAREVSEHTRAFQRQRQLLEYYVNGTTEKTRPLPFDDRDFKRQREKVRVLRSRLTDEPDTLTGAGQWDSEPEKQLFLADWERHAAILSIASRSFEFAGHALCRSIRRIIGKECSATWPSLRQQVGPLLAAISPGTAPPGNLVEDDDGVELSKIVEYAASQDGLLIRSKMLDNLLVDINAVLTELGDVPFRVLSGATRLVAVLKSLCRLVQWVIVVVEGLHFSRRCDADVWPATSDYRKRKRELLTAAERMFGLFNRLVHLTPPSEAHQYRQVRQTMETQMSSVFALLQRYRKGHRCLEAATELRPQRDPSMNILSTGIVELHRAQLFLIHAQHVGSPFLCSPNKEHLNSDGGEVIPTIRKFIGLAQSGAMHGESDARDELDSLIDRFFLLTTAERESQERQAKKNPKPTPSRTITRLINDAERSMQKAESILVTKRKNVWWSTWLFELQIKAIEYRLLLSIFDATLKVAERAASRFEKTESEGETMRQALRHVMRNHQSAAQSELAGFKHGIPVQDFGSRACPRGQETRADTLLGNTIRMVRLDLIRMSRVVESYSLCYRGLGMLLSLNPELERLPRRLQMMREKLVGVSEPNSRGAIAVLQRRLDQRQRMPPTVDPFVIAYTNYVLGLAHEVTKS